MYKIFDVAAQYVYGFVSIWRPNGAFNFSAEAADGGGFAAAATLVGTTGLCHLIGRGVGRNLRLLQQMD